MALSTWEGLLALAEKPLELETVLLFSGGWCLGVITSVGWMYEAYTRKVNEFRMVESMRWYQLGHRDGTTEKDM